MYEKREIIWVKTSDELPPTWRNNFSKPVLCYDFENDVCVVGWYDYELNCWETLNEEIDNWDYWAFISKPELNNIRERLMNKCLYPLRAQKN